MRVRKLSVPRVAAVHACREDCAETKEEKKRKKCRIMVAAATWPARSPQLLPVMNWQSWREVNLGTCSPPRFLLSIRLLFGLFGLLRPLSGLRRFLLARLSPLSSLEIIRVAANFF